MTKYTLTNETKEINTPHGKVTLHRIRALRDFGSVESGELGGWIESEKNLSHNGNAWIRNDAKVYGNARVCGNAEVYVNAIVYGDAIVYGGAEVYGNAIVYGGAIVYGNAEVYGNATVYGNAMVYGNATVYDGAIVYGSAIVYGNARISDNGEIFASNHVLVIGAIGSRNDFTTFYRGKNGQIIVKCGCFNGTLDEFLAKVETTHGNNKHAAVYRAAAEIAKLRIDLPGRAKK